MTVSERPRLLIIGADGFIGGRLAFAAGEQFEVIRGSSPDRSGATQPAGIPSVPVDITDREAVGRVCDHFEPAVIALLAAISDIDRCEREPEIAEAVNVRGAENVALGCARIGARLLFTSSGAVFDGQQHGYTEDDPPTPISVYGKTKARAEERIAAIVPDAVILRLSLVMGYALQGGTNSVLNKLRDSFRAGRTVRVPDNEYRNPLDAGTLVEWMLELAAKPDSRGIFHAGASDSLSRYEFTRRLAEGFGCSPELVQPQGAPPPGRAPRGRDHFLWPRRIAAVCRTRVPDCSTVIERCIHETA